MRLRNESASGLRAENEALSPAKMESRDRTVKRWHACVRVHDKSGRDVWKSSLIGVLSFYVGHFCRHQCRHTAQLPLRSPLLLADKQPVPIRA
jgi:hypothetical protein